MIAAYQQDLERSSLVAEPARAARDAARFWNAAAEAYSDWPQQRLTVPDNRPYYALPWEAYPETLHRDVDAWCAWLGGDDPHRHQDKPRLEEKPLGRVDGFNQHQPARKTDDG